MTKSIKEKLKALEERRGETSDQWMKKYRQGVEQAKRILKKL